MRWWHGVGERARHLLRGDGRERASHRGGDLLLLAVLLLPALPGTGSPPALRGAAPPTALLVVLSVGVLVTVAVVVRRTVPLLSLSLVALLPLLYPVLGTSLWTAWAAAVLSLLAGRRVTRIGHAHAVFLGVAAAGLPVVTVLADSKDWLSVLLTEFGTVVLPWWAGNWWRQRSDLGQAGWERAEQLEWRQRFVAEQARLKERARIAEDIHDSLGHELSVMAVLAGGLELGQGLTAHQRATLVQLRERSMTATERLHDVIGLLREDTAPAPHPAHESIAELVRRFERSGTPVRYTTEGAGNPEGTEQPEVGKIGKAGKAAEEREERTDPEAAPAAPSLLAELAAYRVVQEALTNAAKHAPGAPLTVRIARRAGATVVVVANEPPPGEARSVTAAAVPGSGLGLIGLDERVRLAGGTLRAGPHAGGYEVRAELPHVAPPPSSAAARPPSPRTPAWTSGSEAPGASGTELSQARARVRVRRDARRAALVPVLLGTALTVALLGLYLFTSAMTSLSPEAYGRIRVGQSRAELARVLPERHIRRAPPVVAEPAVPPGAACAYYRTGDSVLQFGGRLYRLCFKEEVLVTKEAL